MVFGLSRRSSEICSLCHFANTNKELLSVDFSLSFNILNMFAQLVVRVSGDPFQLYLTIPIDTTWRRRSTTPKPPHCTKLDNVERAFTKPIQSQDRSKFHLNTTNAIIVGVKHSQNHCVLWFSQKWLVDYEVLLLIGFFFAAQPDICLGEILYFSEYDYDECFGVDNHVIRFGMGQTVRK